MEQITIDITRRGIAIEVSRTFLARHFFFYNNDDNFGDDARQLPLGTAEKLEHPRAKRNAVSSTSRLGHDDLFLASHCLEGQ